MCCIFKSCWHVNHIIAATPNYSMCKKTPINQKRKKNYLNWDSKKWNRELNSPKWIAFIEFVVVTCVVFLLLKVADMLNISSLQHQTIQCAKKLLLIKKNTLIGILKSWNRDLNSPKWVTFNEFVVIILSIIFVLHFYL